MTKWLHYMQTFDSARISVRFDKHSSLFEIK